MNKLKNLAKIAVFLSFFVLSSQVSAVVIFDENSPFLDLQKVGGYEVSEAEVENIKRITEALVKGKETPKEKAQVIINWIHTNFQATFFSPYYETITEFFKKRKGDCYHHSALLVLMLRTQKIPARFVNEIDYDRPSCFVGPLRVLGGFIYNTSVGLNHNNHVWEKLPEVPR